MDPITMALISGGLNLIGGIDQKNANIAAAKAGYESTAAFTNRDYGVGLNSLKIQAQEVGNELGMALTDLFSEARNVKASTTAATIEKNIYGASASRSQRIVDTRAALASDKVAQQAEAQMIDVQEQMRSMKYDREAKLSQARQQMNNTINSQPSTLGLIGGAVAAGISGYSSGLSLQSSKIQLDLQKELAGFTQREAERLANLRG